MKNFKLLFLLGGLILFPVVLILLPATYFDTGQSVCLSKVLLHKECPGCGLTRASQHLIHFDFSEAYHFNKLVFVVFPIVIFFWGRELLKTYRAFKNQSSK